MPSERRAAGIVRRTTTSQRAWQRATGGLRPALADSPAVLSIALALGSSACYGVSNFVGPQLARRYALVSVLILSQLAALAACALYLALDHTQSLPASYVWLALLAGLGNAGGLIGFYKAAELGPLSVAAPIGAVGAVLPVTWGLTSGDTLRPPQVIGLVLALGGAVLAARRLPADSEELALYPNPRASAIWAAGSAVAFGVFLTALPKASAHGRPWALFDARLAMVVLLALWAGPRLAGIRLERGSAVLAVPGLLLVTGTLMYTFAANHGQLSLVSVLGSLFPIFTVGLGVTLLHERLSRTQAIGVAAALAGIMLIAL
jgi:drug/metabolite transporter (DMT)-like permease